MKAAADSGFLNDDAIAWDGMVHTVATALDEFAHTDDEATQTEADDFGADEADTIVPEAEADETQSSDDGAANADFTIAQANQTAVEWSALASSLGTPWAQVQSGIAAVLATWASTAASNYLAYVAKLNTAETDYATSDDHAVHRRVHKDRLGRLHRRQRHRRRGSDFGGHVSRR